MFNYRPESCPPIIGSNLLMSNATVLANWHCHACNQDVSATKTCPICNAPEPAPEPQSMQQRPFLVDATGEYQPMPAPVSLSAWECPSCGAATEDSKVCSCGQPEPLETGLFKPIMH